MKDINLIIAYQIHPSAFGPIRQYFRDNISGWESLAGKEALRLSVEVIRGELRICEAQDEMRSWADSFRGK